MAELSGFFNSKITDGLDDRLYDAKDFANLFSNFFSNGVFSNPTNQLKVEAKSGRVVTIKAGKAFINGFWYELTEDMDITIPLNISTYKENNGVICGLNEVDRKITIYVKQNNIDVLRTDNLYELLLAKVSQSVGSTSVNQSDITDMRAYENVCGFVHNPLEHLSTGELFDQYNEIFATWFEEVKGQLSSDVAGNLQIQINSIRESLPSIIQEAILQDNRNKYHIGKIIMSTENVNPQSYLGFGRWEFWGSGRVPVGVDESDASFRISEKIGGEKTHTLTVDEMPSHAHTMYQQTRYQIVSSGGADGVINWKNNYSYPAPTERVGGSLPHNNLQPYITCYMYKRVE